MPPSREWDRIFDINVALKVIRHISSGIYRTPATALKELVNNAFDAQATRVTIDTGPPNHRAIRIIDDGIGLTKNIVDMSFEHVGASVKVLDPSVYSGRVPRPLIGQFGIGLLASAHASKEIKIVTYPRRENYGLEILLDLSPFFEYESQIKTLDEFTFGSVRYRQIPRKNQPGSQVILTKVDRKSSFWQTLTRKGLSFVKWPSSRSVELSPGKGVSDLVDGIEENSATTIEDLRGRERLLWELGLILPVDYVRDGPIRSEYLDTATSRVVGRIRRGIQQMRFRVFLDGVEVKKPIRLPTRKVRMREIDTEVQQQLHSFPISFKQDLTTGNHGKRLQVEGYCFYQSHRIIPRELRGLYPRIHGVGVGQYDNTLFKTVRENPVYTFQLSGELFIEEGLDDALNLDRGGFIEIDPAYQVLRQNLLRIISEDEQSVLALVRRAEAKRRKQRFGVRRHKRLIEQREDLERFLRSVAPGYKIEEVDADELSPRSGLIDYRIVAISHEKRLVLLDHAAEIDPALVATIVGVDTLIGSLPNAAEIRQRLAEKLEHIL